MRRHAPTGDLVCRHCGAALVDHSRSPTGLAHVETGRTRCDGRTMREPGRARTTLAVAR